MPIKKTLDRIPGGMMVVPLFLGCLLKTFFPDALAMGGFVTALTQASPIMAVFFVIVGAQMSFKEAPKAIWRGGVLTVVKLVTGILIGLFVAHFLGDNLFSISSLAIIAAMTNSNGGLYLALTGQYGTKTDTGAYVVTALNDGPFFTMIALGTAGLVSVPFTALLSVIIPIVFGMIIGNLDENMREFLSAGSSKFIPFFSFALGTGLTLEMLISGGVSGILLGVITTFIGGIILIVSDKLSGGSGVAGAALASTAGNAVATPAAIAEIDKSIAASATIAMPQIAASTITTAILTPILVNFWVKRLQKKGIDPTIEKGNGQCVK
ncbi:2-keto-3-deoxygluconate permease [Salmonella enterica subsp. enterica]|nr:2-keto-3-deoxygluconate permease [Salmonella enterica subsp. enterica serovar Falkensee]EAW1949999.1 2-keto-3-deoxygluconate permease [Salmonella enterica subsp. enterica]EDT4977126.1 2-keto-3-deoxygluconate permease [Salmonella enterica subsp. enterica serovar Mbandaka]EEQ0333819.1 2-keto-3-deoxygluconate permease [Salmonella enterica]EBN9136006.1 2-keto-3-deoxygluconate permease [Salmonella enterica subsp. enterica serovar Falkensee]